MRILFVVNNNKGRPGGHIFSLEHTVCALSPKMHIGLFVLGEPAVNLKELPSYIDCAPFSLKSYRQIKEKFLVFKPDVIHCFDVQSYIFVSMLYSFRFKRIILTHCGGPNPNSGILFPYSRDIILYSRENVDFFRKKKLFRNINFHFLPNRVYSPLLHYQVTHEYPNSIFNICQIIRIDESKRNNIFLSLNLIKLLINRNINVHFTLVGVLRSDRLYNDIKSYISAEKLESAISLYTGEEASRGSSFLQGCDCVIATGRSVMEASSIGKVILCPTANISIPILLQSDNFEELFDTNFSGRAEISSDTETQLSLIVKLITDVSYRNQIINDIANVSSKYFALTSDVIAIYERLYKTMRPLPLSFLFIRNSWIYLYYLLTWIKIR